MSNNSTITENPGENFRQLRGKALWAALATLIDGEGAIFIVCAGKDYTTKIQIGNVCREWMETWQVRVGRGRVVPGEQPKGCKQVFRWVIQKKADVVFILKRIMPYLFVKVEQAKLAIDFIEKKKSYIRGRAGLPREGNKIPAQELAWREGIRQRMRTLNAKGNPERLYVESPMSENDIVRAIEPSIEPDDNALVQ